MSLNRAVTPVAAALLVLVWSSVALGHAELVETDPVDGATITTPNTLTATFSEPLADPSNVIVRNSTGEEVARGLPDPEAPEMLKADLPQLSPGEYVANWTIRATDGHTDRGDFRFIVDPVATRAPTAAPRPTPSAAPGTPTDGTGSSNDVVIALVIAAIAVGGIGAFIVTRMRP